MLQYLHLVLQFHDYSDNFSPNVLIVNVQCEFQAAAAGEARKNK